MERLRIPILIAAFFVLCMGIQQIAARPSQAAPGGCPYGGDCGCSTAYAPVICKGNCRYTNMCHAKCAGFTSSQCKDALN